MGALSIEGTNITVKNNILMSVSINLDRTTLSTLDIDYNLYVNGLYIDHCVGNTLAGGQLTGAYPIANGKHLMVVRLINIRYIRQIQNMFQVQII